MLFNCSSRYQMRMLRILPFRAMCLLLILILVVTIIWKSGTRQHISNIQNLLVSKQVELVNIELNNVSECYRLPNRKSINYFFDIMDHVQQPSPGKAIFFHETSCSKTGIAKLNSRYGLK